MSNYKDVKVDRLLAQLKAIPGGYTYSGACSYQVCFPLKAGGELRFMLSDDSDVMDVDLYDGALSPGITGPANKTG